MGAKGSATARLADAFGLVTAVLVAVGAFGVVVVTVAAMAFGQLLASASAGIGAVVSAAFALAAVVICLAMLALETPLQYVALSPAVRLIGAAIRVIGWPFF
jgi:hypothetical protein